MHDDRNSDEDSIGIESADGGRDLVCRVYVGGSEGRSFSRAVSTSGKPGRTIRCTLRLAGYPHTARLLAYVDPMTGQLVVRMGMLKKDKKGRTSEEDEQIVWTSDAPVYSIT